MDEFVDFLRTHDAQTLPFRAERLRFLVESFGEPRDMFLGQMSAYYFEEAKLCYINEAFASCVLIVQAAMEDLLRHFFRLAEEDRFADKAGFKELIDKSVSERFITKIEAENMHQVRTLRNPYVHTKGLMHRTGFLQRAKESGFEKDDWDLMKEDAEKAVLCFFNLIRRRPFSFHEDV